jgi:hypothetical protein
MEFQEELIFEIMEHQGLRCCLGALGHWPFFSPQMMIWTCPQEFIYRTS